MVHLTQAKQLQAEHQVIQLIQSDAVGMKGVREFDVSSVKQIGMAGSPAYTS